MFGAGVALISSTSGRNVYKVDAMSELVAWTSSTSGRGEVEGEEFSATVAAVSVCCRDRFEWGAVGLDPFGSSCGCVLLFADSVRVNMDLKVDRDGKPGRSGGPCLESVLGSMMPLSVGVGGLTCLRFTTEGLEEV